MIRLATIKDIPQLAKLWYAEKAKTCYAQLAVEWSVEGCATFLAEVLGHPQYRIVVCDQGGQIIAAIGCLVYHDLLPPHPIVLSEWMWFGTNRRAVVKVLQFATAWGKEQGATLLRYVLNVAGKSPTAFTETYQWRVL